MVGSKSMQYFFVTMLRFAPWLSLIVASCGSPHPVDALAVKAASTKRAESSSRCPLIPLELVVQTESGNVAPILKLDAVGTIHVPWSLVDNPPPIVFDPRGCILFGGEVIADATRTDLIWTSDTWARVRDGRMAFDGNPRSHRVESNGIVTTLDHKGELEPKMQEVMFKGFAPDATCAARLLYIAFLSMMPSMAHTDGYKEPPIGAPPEGSACPDKPHRTHARSRWN